MRKFRALTVLSTSNAVRWISSTREEILRDQWRCLGKEKVMVSEDNDDAQTASSSLMGSMKQLFGGGKRSHEGKGQFNASPTGSDAASSQSQDIEWTMHERLDFYLYWNVPKNWQVHERVGENYLNVQCNPPPSAGNNKTAGPQIHGMSLSAFAYHRKVKDPNSEQLMIEFLERFGKCVSNSVQILGSSSDAALSHGSSIVLPKEEQNGKRDVEGTGESQGTSSTVLPQNELCHRMASRIGGSFTEIQFSPIPNRQDLKAKGLCRSFYHTNRRFHYIALMAVPWEEYSVVQDLVTGAVCSVGETNEERRNRL